MKFLIATPDVERFLWQMLVQINSFEKMGYLNDLIYVVGKQPNVDISENLKIIIENTKAEIYIYDDTRGRVNYTPTLRPHILKKFFIENSDISNDWFYTDPDVLFTQKIDFSKYLGDDKWYLSDTRSYIDSRYIKSKSEELFREMCNIVNVDPVEIENMDDSAGGAQYLMKGIDYEFWNKVERDSELLYNHMVTTKHIYSPDHPIQAWTADMWAVLWNGKYFKNEISIADEFDFSWATDSITKWEEKKIFHNAGATDQSDFFVKNSYDTIKKVFSDDFSFVNENNITFNYVKEIMDTKSKYGELFK